jgi:uncharacterized delta-60 repeat protein
MRKIIYTFTFSSTLLICNFLYSQVIQDWVVRYDGPALGYDKVYSMEVDESGNVYVTGSSAGMGTGQDYLTIKYNADGIEQWTARYNGPLNHHDQAYCLAVGDSGNLYVTGGSFGNGTERDFFTIKYNSNGDTIWTRRYNGPGFGLDEAVSVVLDSEDNVYVTGYSVSGDNLDYYTIKYNSSGVEQWGARYSGTGNGVENRPHFLTVDEFGNVYVTGESNTGFGFLDMYATVKYNSAGVQQWAARYKAASDSGLSQAYALAVDDNGNVYVTGRSDPSSPFGFNFDIVTIKYNSDGDSVWVHRYNGPANSSDIGNSVAVDGEGNIIVTGLSVAGTSSDYFTIKYSPSGDTLWTARYNGPENNVDVAASLVIDDFNNIYVTGFSTGNGTLRDYATIKYNSSGLQQWVQRYNGPGNNDDESVAVTIDNSNNIYVTGSSTGSGTGMDYATIKYNSEIVPVELTSFTAESINSEVVLIWQTSSEINNMGFEVERNQKSEDGIRTEWEKISFINGKGTTSESQTYSFTDIDVSSGKYFYRLKQLDYDGSYEYSEILEVKVGNTPEQFALEQNYPNPFNPSTIIIYHLPVETKVVLKVYNVLGREVAELVNEIKKPGVHEVEFINNDRLSSGTYFYTINAGTFTDTKKLILIK